MGMTRGESALNGDWSLLRVAGVINERVGAGSGVYIWNGAVRWSPRRNAVRKGLVAHPIESNRSKSARKQIRAQLKSSFFINVHFRYVLDTCSFYVTHHLQVSSPLSVINRLVSAPVLLAWVGHELARIFIKPMSCSSYNCSERPLYPE